MEIRHDLRDQASLGVVHGALRYRPIGREVRGMTQKDRELLEQVARIVGNYDIAAEVIRIVKLHCARTIGEPSPQRFEVGLW